jgi:integrase/recombinase XerD
VPSELALAGAGRASPDPGAEALLTALVLDAVTSETFQACLLKRPGAVLRLGEGTSAAAVFKSPGRGVPRMALEQDLAPATVNLRLSPLRKLAQEMADNGLLSRDLAKGVGKTKGVKQKGVRAGNWAAGRAGQ